MQDEVAHKIYSYRGSKIVAAEKWLQKVLQKMNGCLSTLPQLQFHGSLILVENFGREVRMSGKGKSL